MKIRLTAASLHLHIDNDQGEEVLALSYANYNLNLDAAAAIRGAGPLIQAVMALEANDQAAPNAPADVSDWVERDLTRTYTEGPDGLPAEAEVEFKCRVGGVRKVHAGHIDWSLDPENPHDGDIIAYRIID